jgi:selenide,water dikinase
MGLIDPKKIWTNSQAKIGDKLILTKPLGTGAICAGIKKQELLESDFQEAIESMKRLNNILDFLSEGEQKHIHSATDITGFGLLGHSYQMAQASQVSLQFKIESIPVFKEAYKCIEKGFLTKAHKNNEEYTMGKVYFTEEIKLTEKLITFDPQTSGGLLLSVDPKVCEEIVQKLSTNFPGTSVVGEVRPKNKYDVYVER